LLKTEKLLKTALLIAIAFIPIEYNGLADGKLFLSPEVNQEDSVNGSFSIFAGGDVYPGWCTKNNKSHFKNFKNLWNGYIFFFR